jgi:hypothetical protein
MTPDALFSMLNMVAAAAWLLLLVLPRQRWVADLVTAAVVPALFAAIYAVILATQWGSSEGGFSTLADVARLFDNPWLLLAGWVHYLAFDLLVGSWEVRDARAHDVPHLLVIPCLVLTFLFGPVGWLLYMGLRALRGRGWRVEAA